MVFFLVVELWIELRAVQSLYCPSDSLANIAGSKSDLFRVRVGLRQGCPLFITFMGRIYRCSQMAEGVRHGGLRIPSLLCADDVALQLALRQLGSSWNDAQLL